VIVWSTSPDEEAWVVSVVLDEDDDLVDDEDESELPQPTRPTARSNRTGSTAIRERMAMERWVGNSMHSPTYGPRTDTSLT
jgi:ectoine hydroxylase-related dioxygenase (phytanoyl-CoA dioxygenase family)